MHFNCVVTCQLLSGFSHDKKSLKLQQSFTLGPESEIETKGNERTVTKGTEGTVTKGIERTAEIPPN